MQAVWQKYIDASISSTINLPYETTVEEVAEVYISAWRNGLKGITIYRDGCERGAVLVNTKKEKTEDIEVDEDDAWVESKQVKKAKPTHEVKDDNEPAKGVCPKCGEAMAFTGGCDLCLNCGWSKCQ